MAFNRIKFCNYLLQKIERQNINAYFFTHKNIYSNSNGNKEDMRDRKIKELQAYLKLRKQKFELKKPTIILDFIEELEMEASSQSTQKRKVLEEPIPDVSLKRGETGVFDIEEIVELLREENLKDIVVIKIPKEIHFVDYLVICTGKSLKHLKAISELIRKVYKLKMDAKDQHIITEGKNSDWIAMDIGNIAVHLMTKSIRVNYDLETLWTVDPYYDEKLRDYEDGLPDFIKDNIKQMGNDSSGNPLILG